jgi:hypothetical protein
MSAQAKNREIQRTKPSGLDRPKAITMAGSTVPPGIRDERLLVELLGMVTGAENE